MKFLKKHFVISIIIGTIALAIILWFLFFTPNENQNEILISPKQGKFLVTVTTTGELKAINAIEIMPPMELRNIQIWQVKIAKLVPEGTMVKKGDFVAELDKSDLDNKIKDVKAIIEKLESQYTQQKIDTTLSLSKERDNLLNLQSGIEEKKLEKEQSIYETPAVQRQVAIAYERAQRDYEQAIKNYALKIQQEKTKTKLVQTDLIKEKQKLEQYQKLMESLTIKSPSEGMVVYAREWDGGKRTIGSTVYVGEKYAIATLPDLGAMESVTYVNEIDIQKIKLWQQVQVSVDAVPNKIIKGTITDIANVGGQSRMSEAKVFETKVALSEKDVNFRPGFTTMNKIIVATLDSVIFIPLECVHTQDTTTYIYKKRKNEIVKQQVQLGMMNDNDVVILKGVNKTDEIFLSIPSEKENISFVMLNK